MGDPLRHSCVFGLGWGDEGKGKIVDLLCPAFTHVVRFNGGANAGHTVCVGGQSFALHLLPAGVLHQGSINVIGPGVVVDPISLLAEVDGLAARDIDVMPNLRVSERAHIVMPYHKIEDQLGETAAGEKKKIGTTARGIGPCYADKMRRSSAIRFADLQQPDALRDRIGDLVARKSRYFAAEFGESPPLDADAIYDELMCAYNRLSACCCDTTSLLHEAGNTGTILFEGANGFLLDVNHGTYPFVTSSSTGPHGIGPGAGVPPRLVDCSIGVTKAYATRVGSGPFFSELNDATGDHIRKQGNEYGTTTGRPRRCGWFDAVVTRYATLVTGTTDIALMHLDTLSGFSEVGICTGYRINGATRSTPPASMAECDRVEPIIEMIPGWSEDLRSVRRFEDLPANTRQYVERIESLLDVPVSLLGIGPDRSQTLVRGKLTGKIDVPEPSAV
ncbi:MAG: adenylosuccinate synthase [Planctomycetota bacterium]|jgi:adenylosuccinate synthase